MQWWNSFVDWLTAASTLPVFYGAIIFVIAIVLASLLAAWTSRGAVRGLINQRDRELRAAAIGALVDAATEASVWNSLTPQEQVLADRAVGQADIQVRLLPVKGSSLAANWAAHQLAEFKRTSATFGYQLEPAVLEFRDRLIDWQLKPSRARKIFQGDLDRWKMQGAIPESGIIADQDAWVAKQHHEQFAAPLAPASTLGAGSTVGYTARDAASPSTETQRLLDDVQALEVRPPAPEPTAAVPTQLNSSESRTNI